MTPVDRLLDQAFADPPPESTLGLTLATVVVHGGEVVAERYGPDTDATTRLISWSTAKSVTQAVVGILVRDGHLDLHAPVDVPEWRAAGDPRAGITLDHLLHMRSGLAFVEDYVDDTVSDVIEMLFGEGRDDVAGFAARFPLAHPPGEVWSYSSGTTNIVAAICGRTVARATGRSPEDAMRTLLHEELFAPLGMNSAEPRFDAAGTFVGSSFLYATARDFARFGELYLHDGVWDGRRILPEGWVTYARTPTFEPRPPEEPDGYGAHWWLWPNDLGTFGAHGYEGQYIAVVPPLDLVVVRLGKTPDAQKPHVRAWLDRIVDELR